MPKAALMTATCFCNRLNERQPHPGVSRRTLLSERRRLSREAELDVAVDAMVCQARMLTGRTGGDDDRHIESAS